MLASGATSSWPARELVKPAKALRLRTSTEMYFSRLGQFYNMRLVSLYGAVSKLKITRRCSKCARAHQRISSIATRLRNQGDSLMVHCRRDGDGFRDVDLRRGGLRFLHFCRQPGGSGSVAAFGFATFVRRQVFILRNLGLTFDVTARVAFACSRERVKVRTWTP